MKQSLEKAIELGPDVGKHSQSAVSHLEAEELASALPDQEEDIRLLKEIAEPISKQQEQQQKDNQDQDSDKKDEEKVSNRTTTTRSTEGPIPVRK